MFRRIDGNTGVITRIGNRYATVLCENGSFAYVSIEEIMEKYERTTTNIPIKTLLAQMAESQAVND